MSSDSSTENDADVENDREDVAEDDALANSRATGGVPDPDKPDQAVTTGTTEKAEYVGRIAGDDIGYTEEQGSEARAEAENG